MKQKIITAIFLTMFFVLEAHAEENVIRLICKYSHYADAGGTGQAKGETFFTVRFSGNGDATIKEEGYAAEFTGWISDEKINGECNYKVAGTNVTKMLAVNRFTGVFKIYTDFVRSSEPIIDLHVIHYGKCEPVTKKQF